MDDEDEYGGQGFDPVGVLKMALVWVPQHMLYHGVVEMLDYLNESEDDVEMVRMLEILFRAATLGECFHAQDDEEPEHPSPITEEDLKKFQQMLDIKPEEDYSEGNGSNREENN